MFREEFPLADRITQLPHDPLTQIFLQIPKLDEERKQKGLPPVLRLNVGEPHLPIAPVVPQALSSFLSKPEAAASFAYPPMGGSPKTLEAVAKLFENYHPSITFSTKDVMVCSGSTQGMWNAYNILLNPGDEVAVFEPFYGPYQTQAALLGAKVIKISTLENNFRPTAEQLETCLSEHPKVKAVVFNYPNNPSGIDLTEEEAKEMAEVLLRFPKVAILIDDVYRELNDKKHATVVDVCPRLMPRTGIFDSGSKSLIGAPGMRMGMVAANPKWIANMIMMQSLNTASVPSLVQFAAQEAIQARLENAPSYVDWLVHSCEEYAKNINYVALQTSRLGFESVYGGNGIFLLTSAKNLIGRPVPDSVEFVTAEGEHHCIYNLQSKVGSRVFQNDTQIVTYLLHAAGVALVPGCAFGIPEKEGYLRFSCAKKIEELEKALSYITQAVENIPFELKAEISEKVKVSEQGLFANKVKVKSLSPTTAAREILRPGCNQHSN